MSHDPIADAVLDTATYTDYQRTMARAYNTHPSLFPAAEPDEDAALAGVNASGFKRRAPGSIPQQPPSVAEQERQLAVTYGVKAEYVKLPAAEDEAAAAAAAALDERRLARRAAIMEKYGVTNPDHIPLAWLDD
jgi:hypothetical protein